MSREEYQSRESGVPLRMIITTTPLQQLHQYQDEEENEQHDPEDDVIFHHLYPEQIAEPCQYPHAQILHQLQSHNSFAPDIKLRRSSDFGHCHPQHQFGQYIDEDILDICVTVPTLDRNNEKKKIDRLIEKQKQENRLGLSVFSGVIMVFILLVVGLIIIVVYRGRIGRNENQGYYRNRDRYLILLKEIEKEGNLPSSEVPNYSRMLEVINVEFVAYLDDLTIVEQDIVVNKALDMVHKGCDVGEIMFLVQKWINEFISRDRDDQEEL